MKRYFSCFFFFSLFSFSFLSAQVNEKDLRKMSYDELKELFFNEKTSISEQKKIAGEFVKKAKKENDQSKLARGYYYNSLIHEGENKIIYFDSIINYTKTPKIDKNFPIAAYFEKGIFLESLFKFDEAINCYLQAEKIAKDRNIDYYYLCKHAIGVLKSEKMGEVEEALPLFKENFSFFKKKENEVDYSFYYENSLFAMADAYKSLKKIDSSTYYNVLGYNHSKKYGNEYLNGIFILNEGANQSLKRNYVATIDSVRKALPIIIKNKDLNNELAAYYYYGKAYEGLKNEKKAINYFKKVDSMYIVKGTITPEFISGYSYLIEYYRKINDKDNQLLYIDKFVKIDSILQKNYKRITKKIQKDYDIPHLMQEKEAIINGLHQDKKTNYWIIGLLGFVVVLSLFVMQQLVKQKKQYKQRFEALMQHSKIDTLHEDERREEEEKTNLDLGIPDDIVNAILKQIVVFENKKHFLKPNITIGDLATKFDTNSKYLSILINAKKEKSFSNYINDLRIDFAVSELKINKEMRKYTIAAIAEEVGFNTSESFSKAFFKRTGIKPSYFMKELKEV
jgi:AraC-like DNA-binding protein